jgi:hypothetical protein
MLMGCRAVPTTSQDIADFRAAQITKGRYDRLVDGYSYPLAIYVEAQPTVAPSGREVWQFYQTLHACLLSVGLTRLTGRVVATDLPRNGRFRVWTDWFAEGAGRAPQLIAATICFCTGTPENGLTEMVQFTDVALPALREALIY